MQITIKNQENYLREHEIKPSLLRLKIFDFLVKSKQHPSVDMIYKTLSPEIPTLSKTTVYNTLKVFEEKGIVLVVNIEDKEARYDADINFHGHFKCESCGDLYDFPVEPNAEISDVIKGFLINETHYYLKGTCLKCI